MRNRNRWMIVVVAMLALLLAACGGDTATPSPTDVPAPAPTDVPAPEPTDVPAPEPTEEPMMESSLLIWADETRSAALVDIVKEFEDQFGVGVVIQQLGFGDIRDQLKIAGPAGEGPDILIGAHDWLGELVVNGLLEPIDLGDKEGEFVQTALDAFSFEGKLYGMPYQTENVALFRNVDLVPDAPESWADLEAVCQELTDAGTIEVCFALQQGDPYHFFGVMSSFGGRVFGQTEDGTFDADQVMIDSEGSIAAANFLADMVEKGFVVEGTDGGTANGLFQGGEAAFMITGPWGLPDLRKLEVPYAISPLPAGTEAGAPFLGVQGFMVSAFSADPLLAQAFLTEFVATSDVMAALVAADPRPSAYIPVLETQDDPDLAGFADAGVAAIPMPSIPEMSSVWSAWGDALTLIQTGQEQATTAFENAAEQIRTTIDGG